MLLASPLLCLSDTLCPYPASALRLRESAEEGIPQRKLESGMAKVKVMPYMPICPIGYRG
jgi:hypothetical protein